MTRKTTATAIKPVTYYRDRDFLITSTKAKSPRKTYRLDKIEKVSLRRDPFYILLAFSAFFGFFLLKMGWAVDSDIYFYFGVVVAITAVSRKFGLLMVTSKAVSELAFIGLYDRLVIVREAIEKAMHKEDLEDGTVPDDDEEEDDDE